jgi:hypothetical protein
MRNFSQEMVNSLDKTTEDGFTEALMICIASLKDQNGLLINVRLGNTIEDQIHFAKQITRMMLNKEKANETTT